MQPNDSNIRLLAKILGELYRMESAREAIASPASPARIYGLLNGFESEIHEELDRIGWVSQQDLKAVVDVLEPFGTSSDKLQEFTGYYDIEEDLKNRGIDRRKAITILKFLKANGQFEGVIAKMDSSRSPSECRTFDLDMWDA